MQNICIYIETDEVENEVLNLHNEYNKNLLIEYLHRILYL